MMKGLLLKDFYMMGKYCRAFLFIIIVFIAVSLAGDQNLFFVTYPVLLGSIIPVTLISYDERSKWCSCADTMPYTRKKIVSSKYLMMLIILGISIVLTWGSQWIKMLVTDTLDMGMLEGLIKLLVVVGLVCPSILLPFIFRFGSEKGRIAYYIVILAACASMTFTGSSWGGEEALTAVASRVQGLLLLAVLLLAVLSWVLSVHFYEKREL